MSAKLAITKNVKRRELTLERVLDGPRDLVWQCLVTAEYLDQWWGPEGWTTKSTALDARVGGIWHYCMRGGDAEVWGLATYEEVHAPELITYVETGSNAAAEKLGNKQQHVAITLVKLDEAQTKVTICTRFKSVADLEDMAEMGMAEGYGGALDKLEAFIKKDKHGTN